MSFPALTLLIVLPALGAVVVAALPRRRPELPWVVALGLSVLPLGVAGWLVWSYPVGEAGYRFVEDVTWSESLGVGWRLGVDGISLFLVALTAVLFPIAIAASRTVSHRVKAYLVNMLLLEAGILGVFVALDLLVFFAFFEVVLVPMFLLIGIWGSERRRYAAVKFVLYTAAGSIFLLAGIIALGVLGGDLTGRIADFDLRTAIHLPMDPVLQRWLFAAFAVAFAVKVPLFPLHTWLPDAHTEAPTAGSIILAGVLLKMGTYGLLRFNLTLFPQASVDLAVPMALLGVVGIVYGAAVAIVQPDVKRLVAYSSVSHLGFIVLGTFALTRAGITGGVFQMVSHGLTTGALFLLVGMLYDRRHTRRIAEFGGLATSMPIFAGFFLFMAFASVGLPGLSGFVGEFTILLGSYLTFPALAIVAGGGVILAAVYLLWAYERMFTGPVEGENATVSDLGLREILVAGVLTVAVLGLGVYPKPLLERIGPSVDAVVTRIEATTGFTAPQAPLVVHAEEEG